METDTPPLEVEEPDPSKVPESQTDALPLLFSQDETISSAEDSSDDDASKEDTSGVSNIVEPELVLSLPDPRYSDYFDVLQAWINHLTQRNFHLHEPNLLEIATNLLAQYPLLSIDLSSWALQAEAEIRKLSGMGIDHVRQLQIDCDSETYAIRKKFIEDVEILSDSLGHNISGPLIAILSEWDRVEYPFLQSKMHARKEKLTLLHNKLREIAYSRACTTAILSHESSVTSSSSVPITSGGNVVIQSELEESARVLSEIDAIDKNAGSGISDFLKILNGSSSLMTRLNSSYKSLDAGMKTMENDLKDIRDLSFLFQFRVVLNNICERQFSKDLFKSQDGIENFFKSLVISFYKIDFLYVLSSFLFIRDAVPKEVITISTNFVGDFLCIYNKDYAFLKMLSYCLDKLIPLKNDSVDSDKEITWQFANSTRGLDELKRTVDSSLSKVKPTGKALKVFTIDYQKLYLYLRQEYENLINSTYTSSFVNEKIIRDFLSTLVASFRDKTERQKVSELPELAKYFDILYSGSVHEQLHARFADPRINDSTLMKTALETFAPFMETLLNSPSQEERGLPLSDHVSTHPLRRRGCHSAIELHQPPRVPDQRLSLPASSSAPVYTTEETREHILTSPHMLSTEDGLVSEDANFGFELIQSSQPQGEPRLPSLQSSSSTESFVSPTRLSRSTSRSGPKLFDKVTELLEDVAGVLRAASGPLAATLTTTISPDPFTPFSSMLQQPSSPRSPRDYTSSPVISPRQHQFQRSGSFLGDRSRQSEPLARHGAQGFSGSQSTDDLSKSAPSSSWVPRQG